MVRSRANKSAALFQRRITTANILARSVKVLNYFGAHNNVKRLGLEVLKNLSICREAFEPSLRIGGGGERNATSTEVDSDHVATTAKKLRSDKSVAATNVKHTRSWPQQSSAKIE